MKSGLITLLMLPLLLAACTSEKQNTIEITTRQDQLVLGSEKNSRLDITFTATESWKASVDVDWATVVPMTGLSGEQTISLVSKTFNNSGSVRQGSLNISTITDLEELVFTQAKADVVNLEDTKYVVGTDGGLVSVKFSSNVLGYKVLMVSQSAKPTWITGKKDANTPEDAGSGPGDSLHEYEYQFSVSPNDTHETRSCSFYINIVNPENHNEVYITSAQFCIEQSGLPVETSVDYSRNNTVKCLQSHTAGLGFPVVLMGDGFVDTEHASGHYDEVMKQTMENLFTEEPVKSMREYFDVWQVNMVSENNAFGSQYKTALDCVMQGDGSSRIIGDFDKIVAAAQNVEDMRDENRLHEALVIVILNTPQHAGTTNFGISFDGVMSNFAIAYVPLIDNDPQGEDFRSVLCHESLGHGIAKLLDEYAYESNDSSVPVKYVNQYSALQESYGWCANVSFSSSKVLWEHLLSDSHYQQTDAFGEKLGVYEGACGYLHGAWRPTEDSMMFHNRHGFNAPSREAIYKRIMSVAMGADWEYELSRFLEFDQAHLPQPSSRASAAAEADAFRFMVIDRPLLSLPMIGRTSEGVANFAR